MQPNPQNFIQSLHLQTRHVPLGNNALRQLIRYNHTTRPNALTQSASAKLFADAEKEEAEEAANEIKLYALARIAQQEHPNWDGDERVEDAVLRMLMDKYKPLRSGTIQSAEEKIRRNPPKLAPAFSTVNAEDSSAPVKLEPSTGSWATEVLLPAKEGHQPWHTEFKVPSTSMSSVKFAHIPPASKNKAGAESVDDRARRKLREEKKRTLHVNKLALARESTFDYRLGIKGREVPSGTLNPSTIKGWNSLIEDKIETARKAGLFNSVKGRGKPLQRSMDEYNPFIAREEFLMNRIVQRNNAAPPWVELQRELDSSVTIFREILREAWIRRTVRILGMEHPQEILRKFTLADIKGHRDSEWIAKEKNYHETAISKLNALVRNYNGLAPYAVRRAYYTREAEIENLYKDCAPAILQAIAERGTEKGTVYSGSGNGERSGSSSGAPMAKKLVNASSAIRNGAFLNWLRLLLRRIFGVRN